VSETPPGSSASPPEAPPGGPYLQTAVLCEKVLHEQDGVLSLIRVVDRIVSSAVGPEPPAEMPPVAVNLTAVILLKSGSARGRHQVRIVLEAPSGQDVGPEVHLPVLLEGEDRGVNLVVNLGFQAEDEGLYWFNVYFGDQGMLLTRIPLRIVYQPQRVGTAPSGPDE
jgi:uncharacterized protein DUF6941